MTVGVEAWSAVTDPTLPRLPMMAISDIPAEYRAGYEQIAESRGGMPYSFASFFNSPPAALALAAYGSHVRFASRLPLDLKEVVIMQVAASTDDAFMWAHHAGISEAAGLSVAELGEIRGAGESALSTPERTLTSALTVAVVRAAVTDDLFERGRSVFGDELMVEITFAASYYVMLHTIFSALRIVGAQDTRRPIGTAASSQSHSESDASGSGAREGEAK